MYLLPKSSLREKFGENSKSKSRSTSLLSDVLRPSIGTNDSLLSSLYLSSYINQKEMLVIRKYIL